MAGRTSLARILADFGHWLLKLQPSRTRRALFRTSPGSPHWCRVLLRTAIASPSDTQALRRWSAPLPHVLQHASTPTCASNRDAARRVRNLPRGPRQRRPDHYQDLWQPSAHCMLSKASATHLLEQHCRIVSSPAFKRVHGTGPRLIRLPITLVVLRRIIYQLQRASWLPHIDQLMIGAACSLAFFGFMRCGELLGLQSGDVVIRCEPTKHLVASLRASKTDPFRQGCSVSVGSVNDSNAPLCAVRLIEAYQRASALTMAGANHPFFEYKNGEALSRAHLTSVVQRLLERDGCPYATAFKGHSFGSGAATTAAEEGVPDWLIKTMGRWASDAYLTYTKTPQTTLLNVASTLTRRA